MSIVEHREAVESLPSEPIVFISRRLELSGVEVTAIRDEARRAAGVGTDGEPRGSGGN
jgi:hypothetical protein